MRLSNQVRDDGNYGELKSAEHKMTTIAKLPASLSTADARQQDFGFLTDEGGTKVNNLGMGVLSDGTPFLTQRGL
ncbi:hypothetical protein, partial [Sphingopyxis terrae]|uniref:hypothetical protein n=1 Tax=Sphingopyxis terrae TaxID=33052 RepID=UPI001C3F9A3B